MIDHAGKRNFAVLWLEDPVIQGHRARNAPQRYADLAERLMGTLLGAISLTSAALIPTPWAEHVETIPGSAPVDLHVLNCILRGLLATEPVVGKPPDEGLSVPERNRLLFDIVRLRFRGKASLDVIQKFACQVNSRFAVPLKRFNVLTMC